MLTRFSRFIGYAAFAALTFAHPVAAHHVGDGQAEMAAAASNIGIADVTLTGIVEELVVVDRVNDATQRYPILRQGDGSRVALRGEAIQTLKVGAQVNVSGNRTGISFTVNHVETLGSGPKAAPAAATTPSKVAGQFMVAHADYFATGTSTFIYQVINADGSMAEISMPFLPSPLGSGMQVTVDGSLASDGASLVAASISIDAIPDGLGVLAATTSYLVIPVKFPTGGAGTTASPWVYNADPFTPASLNNQVFGSLPTYHSAKEYYNEVSYGQQQLSGVTADNGSGGFLLANVATPPCSNYTAIGTAAANAARLRGYPIDASGNPLAPYTGILYVFNGVPGCGWAGLAYVGWARAWANNTSALWVIGHELGHNFGLLHAGSLLCSGAAIGCGVAGTVAEYGDPFNTMGNSGNTGHFDAAQKSILGWIGTSTVKTHAGGTTTYSLSPIETGGQSVYAVKIPTTT